MSHKDITKMPLSEVYKYYKELFLERNIAQKLVWTVWFIVIIYAFFAQSKPEMLATFVVALMIALLLDCLLATKK